MRKWTMSSCVVLTWCILPIVAVLGSRETGQPAQANISIVSRTQVVLASESVTIKTAKVTASPARPAATWTVRPGETLSAIATSLGVPGGWQALYAANRPRIGPDPDTVSPGTVLTAPRPAAQGQASEAPRARDRHQAAPPPRQASAPPDGQQAGPVNQSPAQAQPGSRPPGQSAALGRLVGSSGGMPRWLEDVLLAAGVLTASAFAAEPAAALARRRKTARPVEARAFGVSSGVATNGKPRGHARRAAKKARIILADYERLIVTYSPSDHAVYVLTPPGEDPAAVLRAARLVLPENTYEDLAGHLGVPSGWPLE